jgi:anti-sigma B factor antagonist
VRSEGGVIVRLAGELDLYNSAEVGVALDQAAVDAPERLVVDLAEVSFVDSTALATLIEAKRGLQESIRLLLAAPNDDVRRALEVSGLESQFTVHETVESALASTA